MLYISISDFNVRTKDLSTHFFILSDLNSVIIAIFLIFFCLFSISDLKLVIEMQHNNNLDNYFNLRLNSDLIKNTSN